MATDMDGLSRNLTGQKMSHITQSVSPFFSAAGNHRFSKV